MAIIQEEPKKKTVYTNVPGGSHAMGPTARPTPRPDAAMGRSEALFRKPVSRPAARPAPQALPAQTRSSTADRRMSQMGAIMSSKGPDLVSFETNPNMDWRQAADINAARTKGYETRRNTAIQAMGGIARDDVSGQGQLEDVRQQGINQRRLEKKKAANLTARDAMTNAYGRQTAEQANVWDKETAEQKNVWDVEAKNREAGFNLMEAGVPGSQAQRVMQSGEWTPDVAGIDVPQARGQQKDKYGFEKIAVFDDAGRKVGERIVRTDAQAGTIGSEKSGVQVDESDILVAEAVLGKDFDPNNMSAFQSKYIEDLKATGRGNLAAALMGGEK